MRCARIIAPPTASISTWTRKISRRDEKSPARCCCYGARPAASVATTTPNKSGAVTLAIFAAPRHCHAGIISPKRRRRRRIGNCAIFLSRESSASHSGARNSTRHRRRCLEKVIHRVPQQLSILAERLAVCSVRQNHVLAVAIRQLAEKLKQIVVG